METILIILIFIAFVANVILYSDIIKSIKRCQQLKKQLKSTGIKDMIKH